MKKVWVLVAIMMLMAVVTAIQAEARPGGLPELTMDSRINDCPGCAVIIALNAEFDTDRAIVK
ncbi:MAG: hypothetical protein ACLQBQ_10940 [Smithella sp.]